LQQLGTQAGGTEYIIPTPPLPPTPFYLLLENGDYLLQENNDKIRL
jgi:hypothetical protein